MLRDEIRRFDGGRLEIVRGESGIGSGGALRDGNDPSRACLSYTECNFEHVWDVGVSAYNDIPVIIISEIVEGKWHWDLFTERKLVCSRVAVIEADDGSY